MYTSRWAIPRKWSISPAKTRRNVQCCATLQYRSVQAKVNTVVLSLDAAKAVQILLEGNVCLPAISSSEIP